MKDASYTRALTPWFPLASRGVGVASGQWTTDESRGASRRCRKAKCLVLRQANDAAIISLMIAGELLTFWYSSTAVDASGSQFAFARTAPHHDTLINSAYTV
jgi:hypothetical protein